jgi:hypothetical protein
VRGRAHTAPLGQQTDLLSRLLSTPDPKTGQFLDHGTVRDQVLRHGSGKLFLQALKELQKLLMAMARVTLADHFSVQDFQGGE